MFSNIGGKLKKLAVILAVLGIIASVISGLVTMAGISSMRMYGSYGIGYSAGRIVAGLLIIAVGFLISWVGTMGMYGLGELIERTVQTEEHTRVLADEVRALRKQGIACNLSTGDSKPAAAPSVSTTVSTPSAPSVSSTQTSDSSTDMWRCGKCGVMNTSTAISCKNCGTYR